MIKGTLVQTFYTALISGLAGWLIASLKSQAAKLKEERNKDDAVENALRDGVRALLHNRLFEYYEEYERSETIPTAVWQEIDNIYTAYHAIGGNGTGTRLYQELRSRRLEAE